MLLLIQLTQAPSSAPVPSRVNALFVTIGADGTFTVGISLWVALVVAVGALIVLVVSRKMLKLNNTFEIDEAEFGVGNAKLKLKPNTRDLQIGYELWIELSTRKIGLPIDFDHDLISQVYDSWYDFFKVTRGLLRQVPASKLRYNESTQKLIGLAIDILNNALRPHLTAHQARFRRWLDRQLAREENFDVSLQDLQRSYPDYDALVKDMRRVNLHLIRYRASLKAIVFNSTERPPPLPEHVVVEPSGEEADRQ